MTLRDGSAIRLFETTNRQMVRRLFEVLTCPSLSQVALRGEETLRDDMTPKQDAASGRKAIFG